MAGESDREKIAVDFELHFPSFDYETWARQVETACQEQYADDSEQLGEFGKIVLELEIKLRQIIDDAAEVRVAAQRGTVRLETVDNIRGLVVSLRKNEEKSHHSLFRLGELSECARLGEVTSYLDCLTQYLDALARRLTAKDHGGGEI